MVYQVYNTEGQKMDSICFIFWSRIFVLFVPYVRFHIFVPVTEWPPFWEIAAHSAYDMFSKYMYLIKKCQFSFSHLGFWRGIFFSDCAYS